MGKKDAKKGDEQRERVSLHPLTFTEAVRGLLESEPDRRKEDRGSNEKRCEGAPEMTEPTNDSASDNDQDGERHG